MNVGKDDIVYFLGIGGIGMSALARYFFHSGAEIHGYDKTPSVITEGLIKEGMLVHYEDRPDLIPDNITLAIYTPAIPNTLKEFQKLTQSGKPLLKRAEVLGTISKTQPTIAIAGTHGKTSVTSMIAHILTQSAVPCTAFIGGIANNFGSNLVLRPDSKWLIMEADEYDRSFLQLQPRIAVVTSMDPDHLDIYGTKAEMENSYQEFAARVPQTGMLIHRWGLPIQTTTVPRISFGFEPQADFRTSDINVSGNNYTFTIHSPTESFEANLAFPGRHNILNALAATATCMSLGLSGAQIAEALSTFKGVWRRLDIIINRPDFLYIDDYAHHPEELTAAISTARTLRPGKHLTGIFQPHLYSRTRDLMDGFAQSLSLLDRLILLDIYPARELPIEGVSSAALLEKVHISDKMILSKEETLEFIKTHPTDVLMTLGAGDIDRMVEKLKQLFE